MDHSEESGCWIAFVHLLHDPSSPVCHFVAIRHLSSLVLLAAETSVAMHQNCS